MESGSIWIGTPKLQSRAVVRIRNLSSGRCVYCEAMIVDVYFCEYYEKRIGRRLAEPQRAFFANEWYRNKLGISTSSGTVDLEVVPADSFGRRIHACLHHPQAVIRIATILGIISITLGVIGVLLGIASFIPRAPAKTVSIGEQSHRESVYRQQSMPLLGKMENFPIHFFLYDPPFLYYEVIKPARPIFSGAPGLRWLCP